jgi:hypothetical protein
MVAVNVFTLAMSIATNPSRICSCANQSPGLKVAIHFVAALQTWLPAIVPAIEQATILSESKRIVASHTAK